MSKSAPLTGEPSPARVGRGHRGSRFDVAVLLAAMAALLAYCGWIIAGWRGIAWSAIAGLVGLALVRRLPSQMFLAAMRAELLPPEQAPELTARFAALCRRAGLLPVPPLYHLDEALPLAFSLGQGVDAAVVIADSLLVGLTQRELSGILAHEIMHLRNHDIRLQQVGLVLGWLARAMSQFAAAFVLIGIAMRVFSLAQLPILALAVLIAAPLGINLLRLALSRSREAEADLGAADLTGDPAGLASALNRLRLYQERLLRQFIPTAHPLHLPTLFADHPPTEERIRRLLQLPQHALQNNGGNARF